MDEFKDVEQALFRCFITTPVKIFNTEFILKSINKNELSFIQMMSENKEQRIYKHKYNCCYAAMSIAYIDNVNILDNRHHHLPHLIDYFSNSTIQLYYRLIDIFYELSERFMSAYDVVINKYIYTDRSRYNWRILKEKDFFRSHYTGIPGTDILGFNDIQRYWIAFNQNEDKQLVNEEQYTMSSFIGASINNPKAVRQFMQNLEKNKEEEGVRRKRKLEGERDDNKETRLSKKIETWEDLVEELERQIDGKDKDLHDLAIEQHEEAVKQTYINQLKEIEKQKLKSNENENDLIDDTHKGLTDEEVIKLIKEKRTRKSMPVFDIDEKEMEKNISRMSNRIDLKELKEVAKTQAKEEIKKEKKVKKTKKKKKITKKKKVYVNTKKIDKLKTIDEDDSI